MMKPMLSRRAILRGAGGAALALPFLRSTASGAPNAGGKSIIFVLGGNGYRRMALHPAPAVTGQAPQVAPGVRALKLADIPGNISPLLERLSAPSLRSRTTIIAGTDRLDASYGDHDTRSALGAFSGTSPPPGYAKETIDAIAARNIYGGSEPRFHFTSMGYGYYPPGHSHFDPAAPSLRTLVTNNLEFAFDQLFAGLNPNGDPTALRRHLLKGKLLDRVKPDYDRLRARVSAADREQIDRHFQSLSEIGELMRRQGAPGCTNPSVAFPTVSEDIPAPQHFKAIAQMVVAAIRCSLCNVFLVDGYYVSNNYHGLSHATDSAPAIDAFVQFKRAQTDIVGELAQLLDDAGTNPVTGRPYLDDTLICYLNELGDINAPAATTLYESVYFTYVHTPTNMQIVTVGNLEGKLRTGYYIDYSKAERASLTGQPIGRAYNSFLVTLANAIGIDPAAYEKGDPGIGDYRGFAPNNVTAANHDVDTTAKRRASLPFFALP
jgi:hypothetical protein